MRCWCGLGVVSKPLSVLARLQGPARASHVRLGARRRRPSTSSRCSPRWATSGASCSSRSSRARFGSARPCRSAGRTLTPRTCVSGCLGRRRSATRRRWVYLPDWLRWSRSSGRAHTRDRVPERRVFPAITEASAYQALTRACKTARVPHLSPHDLRRRRITIWHQSGVPARELAERAGHARPSMSLDVYSHVMPPDELASQRFLKIVSAA